ncbi:conserved Plasmodium protein, unknown function [Plasmodium chabaudi adami]|uniref:Uncharacterized protein n=1 Tax=Plasmodium chabaudi adami TaxID=5826 RepID=A0A1D3RZI7_PLACE|nr:conserved Plasmodium protein, unknown function [Plasmodium chabaudi adami]
MCQEERKKKYHDDILLNLSLTNDDKIEGVLFKLIPILLDEILTCEDYLRKSLIEIISHCIIRCKSLEQIKIPIVGMVENYLKNIDKISNSRILYNSTFYIFMDAGFKNVDDEEKIKFQQLIIENCDILADNKEMGMFMIIKFVESLEILNKNENKVKMDKYISSVFKGVCFNSNGNIVNNINSNRITHDLKNDNHVTNFCDDKYYKKLQKFIMCINEFLAIPIYCIDINLIKFIRQDLVNIYKEKFLNSKYYSKQNHIKMKKNALKFLSNFLCNHSLAYSSYIICSNEKYDEVKEFANVLLKSKQNSVNFNDNSIYVDIYMGIIKYFDNDIYSINYILKIFSIFENSCIVIKEEEQLHKLLCYIYYFYFYFANDANIKSIDFMNEFKNFELLFNNKKELLAYLKENKYNAKLKNKDLNNCLNKLLIYIIGANNKIAFFNKYIDYIFNIIFCNLKALTEENGEDNNNYILLENTATMIEKIYGLEINDHKTNINLLNNSFLLTHIFFNKLKNIYNINKDSYILYNSVNKVLSCLMDYFKNCLNESRSRLIGIKMGYADFKELNMSNLDGNNESILYWTMERMKSDSNKHSSSYETRVDKRSESNINFRRAIIENVMGILDKFIKYTQNSLLIGVVLNWSSNIFKCETCEYAYYFLLFEKCGDIILSDTAKKYLKLHKKEKMPSFDDYIIFISKKLFHDKSNFIVHYFFENTFDNVDLGMCKEKEDGSNLLSTEPNTNEELSYEEIKLKKFIEIDNAKSVIEYVNKHYSTFNIDQLCSLIKYIEVINFRNNFSIESIYLTILIFDIFLISIVNCVNRLKDDYLMIYCFSFTIFMKELKQFFSNSNKNIMENNSSFSNDQNGCTTLIEVEKANILINSHLAEIIKSRLNILLQNMLYAHNTKLVSKSSKMLTHIYLQIKESNEDLFNDLLNILISKNLKEIYNNDEENRVICSIIYLFGYLIKKDNFFAEKYYCILENLTDYLLYIYFDYVKEGKKKVTNEKLILLKYCIIFFYFSFFSKSFLPIWGEIINSRQIGMNNVGSNDAIIRYKSIVSIILEIIKYAKDDITNVYNLPLLKKALKLLSCLPTLKEDSINLMLKEDIMNTCTIGNFQIEKMYGHYISQIFLRLDKFHSNKLSSEFLKDIYEYSQQITSNNSDNEKKKNFVSIILFYSIYYNPFLEYLSKNCLGIGKYFISYIKLENNIYSEYCFLGLSNLFFSILIQANIDINNVNMLENALDVLRHDNYLGEISENESDPNKKHKNANDLLKNDEKKMLPNEGMFPDSLILPCDVQKYIIDINTKEKTKDKNINSMNICKRNNLSCNDLNENNNTYLKNEDIVIRYAENVCNSCMNTKDDLFYINYLKNNEKEVDENFIEEIKKFECRKDHLLKNVYDYINKERNMTLITHYKFLSIYSCSYIYLFLFMQYTNLGVYKYDKKVNDFFSFNNGTEKKNIHHSNDDINELMKILNSNLLKIDNSNKVFSSIEEFKESVTRQLMQIFDKTLCSRSGDIINLKKNNKYVYAVIKYICKKMVINLITTRNDIIKLNYFKHIQNKDVNSTMMEIEESFLHIDYNKLLGKTIYGINALNDELFNYSIVTNNEFIDEAFLLFLIEYLKDVNMEIFSFQIPYFLFFSHAISNTYLIRKNISITFYGVLKNAFVKYSQYCGKWTCKRNEQDWYKDKGNNRYNDISEGEKNWLKEGRNGENLNSKGNTNIFILNVLEAYKKYEGNKKIELFYLDCLNSCIQSSDDIKFDLKVLLNFYLANSGKAETYYDELKIKENNDQICDYTEIELYFDRLLKCNNSNEEKDVMEKIISNYKNILYLEESIKLFMSFLSNKKDINEYVLNNFSFLMIKLLDHYEKLEQCNTLLNISLCVEMFESVFNFILSHIFNKNLSHINDLLYYLINKIPFYIYIKYIYNHMLKDFYQLDITYKDNNHVRSYCSSVILYLLKKKYLLDIEDERIFRDKKRIDAIKEYNKLYFINQLNTEVRAFLHEDGNFSLNMKKEIGKLNSPDKDIIPSQAVSTSSNNIIGIIFLKLFDEIRDVFNVVNVDMISYGQSITSIIVVDKDHLKNKIKINLVNKLKSVEIDGNKINYTNNLDILTNYMTNEITDICLQEFKKRELFDKENIGLLKKLEGKLIARSFIVKNIITHENNYYKDIYNILEKRSSFHFYKFFNDYIKEFLIFLESKYEKDKKGCLISVNIFVESFVNIYKTEEYDNLDLEEIKGFLHIYSVLNELFKRACTNNVDNIYFVIVAYLKCMNLIFLLIRNQIMGICSNRIIKNIDNGGMGTKGTNPDEENTYVFGDSVFINIEYIYEAFDKIIEFLIDYKEYDIFEHVWIFIFNIPSIFIHKIKFSKLYECINILLTKYFYNRSFDDIANYDSNFCFYFFKLAISVFFYSYIEKNQNNWFYFFNFEKVNKFVKVDNLHNYMFDLDKINHCEDEKRNIYEDIIKSVFMKNSVMVNEKDTDSYRPTKYTSECQYEKNYESDTHLYIENGSSNCFNNFGKLLCLLFEIGKNNMNVLSLIKTYLQLMFLNKIQFFQIGDKAIWDKIYNCIYLMIIKNKVKKVMFEHLMDILNILLCIYNTYGFENEKDRQIHLDIRITEFNNCNAIDKPNPVDAISNASIFVFIYFFKIRNNSKHFVFPDYIIQNLKYSIMLNYPHFFL